MQLPLIFKVCLIFYHGVISFEAYLFAFALFWLFMLLPWFDNLLNDYVDWYSEGKQEELKEGTFVQFLFLGKSVTFIIHDRKYRK